VRFARDPRRRWNYFALFASGEAFRPRGFLLLWHLPRAPALCHLARTAHTRATHLDVLHHNNRHARYLKRLGNFPGKGNEQIPQQARLGKEQAERGKGVVDWPQLAGVDELPYLV